MRFRIIDAALLVATVVGTTSAISSARQRYGLQREHARLTNTLGELVVTDPAQLHIQAIDTGEPLHFAWRVYAPAGQIIGDDKTLSSNCRTFDTSAKPREFIARVRFLEDRPGEPGVYRDLGGHQCHSSLASTAMLQFLRDHLDELEIEQLGSEEVALIKPGNTATLLRVKVPQSLIEKARNAPASTRAHRLTADVYECRVELK